MVLQLTNLDSIWTNNSTEEWVYTKDELRSSRIGIGTTTIGVDAQLKVVAGTATTSLEVVNESQFQGNAYFNNRCCHWYWCHTHCW